jgi:hypothetical protein
MTEQNLGFSSFFPWNNQLALADSIVGFTGDLTTLISFGKSTNYMTGFIGCRSMLISDE